jgi:hypothetical protein
MRYRSCKSRRKILHHVADDVGQPELPAVASSLDRMGSRVGQVRCGWELGKIARR